MKCRTWMFALTLTLLPLLATAQLSSTQKIGAQVPFEFAVANKVVPAGMFIVETTAISPEILSLRNADSKVNMFILASRDETGTPAANYALVFHKYGDQCFLWGMKLKGSRTIYRMPRSKAEAELLARNVPATEEILLASLR